MEISTVGKHDDELGAMFAALADPTRRGIVEALRGGPLTVGELAGRFPVGVPAVSKHLTVLERAGLVSRERVAQWRRCRLEAEAFERLNAWTAHYAALWTGSMDRLDGYLSTLTEDGTA